jgi:acetylornithine deacetylase/succinyl-diaminopimelate desuccinylase-like protein
MISAHTDTIFAPDTDLTIRREEGVIYGPGLGDNSAGVAGMLALARYKQQTQLELRHDLWCVATTREEGLGDLGGMRAAFERLRGRVGCVINLEGLAFGHLYHAGISVRRLHITATTSGGHSWLHFGRASAVHAIVTLGARIAAISPPSAPRTTYNIGMIEGGEAINAIATRAGLWLDMRSEGREGLAALEAQVMAAIHSLESTEVAFRIETVGDRPAGAIPTDHPLVEAGLAALAKVGVRGVLETGSTDANVPLSQGVPAVTIGLTRGGNAHRLDEYMETEPVALGLKQIILLALASAEVDGR